MTGSPLRMVQDAIPRPETWPHSYETEQALLGAILTNNQTFDQVADILSPLHFADPLHGRIFDAAGTLINGGQRASAITLGRQFDQDVALGKLGGAKYLIQLQAAVVTLMGVDGLARQILDLWQRREAMGAAHDMMCAAMDGAVGASAKQIIESLEGRLGEITASAEAGRDAVTASDAVAQAVAQTEAAMKAGTHITGVTTGLADLDRRLGGLHRPDLIVLAGRPSMGKAQPLDARVLLADGTWRSMGAIQVGDGLASVDGTPSRVAGVYPQGARPVYRVTLSDGRSTRCCAEHLWQVDSCKWAGGPRVYPTAQLAEMLAHERYRRRVRLPLASGEFGATAGLLLDAWLLGVIIGNGNLTNSTPRVSIADAAVLYRLQQSLPGHMHAVASGDYDYRLSGRQRGVENQITAALIALGLMGSRSEEKFIPPTYLSAPRAARLNLLRGLMDTDGWVETFGAVRYSTSSGRLARDIQTLVRSLGGLCTVSEAKSPTYRHNGENKTGLPHYICNIRHAEPETLVTLRRKQRRCGRIKMPALTIVSIEPDGIEETQCIKVTHPSALYVTDDYIVTHNTALATNIARAVAGRQHLDERRPVYFASLEMGRGQIGQRWLAEMTGISTERQRGGDVRDDEFERLIDAERETAGWPCLVDDSARTVAAIRSRARRMKRRYGSLGLVVVDYLQLIVPEHSRRQDNRVNEITAITVALKAMAKELDVPVLALSQLSRQVESREDKRPLLSDLRESGSIEQDADVVMFVYREEYYLDRREPKEGTDGHDKWLGLKNDAHNRGDIIVAKVRMGRIGTVNAHWNGEAGRWGDLAHHQQSMDL